MPIFSRRCFMRLAGGHDGTLSGVIKTSADNYPTRPIQLIVGFPPGGPNDILGRPDGAMVVGKAGPTTRRGKPTRCR